MQRSVVETRVFVFNKSLKSLQGVWAWGVSPRDRAVSASGLGGGSPACHLQLGAERQSPPQLTWDSTADSCPAGCPWHPWGNASCPHCSVGRLLLPSLGTVPSPCRVKPLSHSLCLCSSWFCRSRPGKGASQPGGSVPVLGIQGGKGLHPWDMVPHSLNPSPMVPKEGHSGTQPEEYKSH